jgi:hypothetical protein
MDGVAVRSLSGRRGDVDRTCALVSDIALPATSQCARNSTCIFRASSVINPSSSPFRPLLKTVVPSSPKHLAPRPN